MPSESHPNPECPHTTLTHHMEGGYICTTAKYPDCHYRLWPNERPLNALAAAANQTAVDHGWWEQDRNKGEIIANIHSEVTEAWKEWVHGRAVDETYYTVVPDDNRVHGNKPEVREAWFRFKDEQDLRALQPDYIPRHDPEDLQLLVRNGILEPHGVPTELADILIRVLDLFRAWSIDADTVVKDKMLFNDHRPYKHGGKRA